MKEIEILFNYNQAVRQAGKLEEEAGKLEKLSNDKMNDTMGALKAAWQSDSSPAYYHKVGKVQDEIKGTASDMKKIAYSIRNTARAVRDAELRALDIAKSRSYR